MLILCYVDADGDGSGEVGDDDADKDDDDRDERIPEEVFTTEDVQTESVAEGPDGDDVEHTGDESTDGTVGNATQTEGTSDERRLGSYKTHGGDGVTSTVDGDTDEAVDEHYRNDEQQRDEEDEEPGEFVEDFEQLVYHALTVGQLGEVGCDLAVARVLNLGTEALVVGRRCVGDKLSVKVHQQVRADGVVLDELHEVIAEVFGEFLGCLILRLVLYLFDIGQSGHNGRVGPRQRVTDVVGDIFGNEEGDINGDALLCVVGGAVGVVFDGDEQAKHEQHQRDAQDSGTMRSPKINLVLQNFKR